MKGEAREQGGKERRGLGEGERMGFIAEKKSFAWKLRAIPASPPWKTSLGHQGQPSHRRGKDSRRGGGRQRHEKQHIRYLLFSEKSRLFNDSSFLGRERTALRKEEGGIKKKT